MEVEALMTGDILQRHRGNDQRRVSRNDDFKGMIEITAKRQCISPLIHPRQGNRSRQIGVQGRSKGRQRFQGRLQKRERERERDQCTSDERTRKEPVGCSPRERFQVEGRRRRALPTDEISFPSRDPIFNVSNDMKTFDVFMVNCCWTFKWIFNALVKREETSFICFNTREDKSF